MNKIMITILSFIIFNNVYPNINSTCCCENRNMKFNIYKFEKGKDSNYKPEEKKSNRNIRASDGNIYSITEIESNGVTYFKITNIKDDTCIWEFIPVRKTVYDEISYVDVINELNDWILNDLSEN